MITTHETLARPVSLSNAATAIFATLGLIDVALTAVIGSPDAPPLSVSLGVAALGLITLLSLVPARRGSRGALTAVVVTPGHLGRARRARVLPERAALGHGRRGIRHRRHDHRPGPGTPAAPAASMRTASAGRAPARAGPRRAAAAELARAVRTVGRWALVVGVTGLLANVLLVVLFTTSADGPYAWTGPTNDVVGDVSTLATIPVAVGLLAVCGHRRGLAAITSLAIVAMAVMTTVSMLMVLGLAPLAAGTDSAYIGMIFMFGWVFAAGRAGRAASRRPCQVANCGLVLGVAGMAGGAPRSIGADAGSLAEPGHYLWRRIAGRHPSGVLPVWLIVLSYRLPGIWLTASAPRGDRPQEDPGAGLPPRLADTWS